MATNKLSRRRTQKETSSSLRRDSIASCGVLLASLIPSSRSTSISQASSSARGSSTRASSKQRSSGYIDRELEIEEKRLSMDSEYSNLYGFGKVDTLCASWRSKIDRRSTGRRERGRHADPWALPPLSEIASLGSPCV